MSQLILIRHGETVWNRERRMQGQMDSPLSEVGLRQAQALARRLSKLEFKTLYCSDSGRAHQTARSVADVTGHELKVEPRLRERHFGVFEGLTGPEIEAQHPEAYLRFKSRDPHYVVPGGESAVAFRDRALTCLIEIAGRHANEVVVIVTHGLVCDIAYRAAHGMELIARRDVELVNAGLNHFRYLDGAWHMDRWGDAAHLDVELTTVT
ncbi:MAG: histidine phosphatase family protein [Betaproteobacteria bacterium]|nr:histidine phosphatase family protein [Betaproteobacteria bacterium]